MSGRYFDNWHDPAEPAWAAEPTNEWHPQFPGQRYPGDIGLQQAPPPGRATITGRASVHPTNGAQTAPGATYPGWRDRDGHHDDVGRDSPNRDWSGGTYSVRGERHLGEQAPTRRHAEPTWHRDGYPPERPRPTQSESDRQYRSHPEPAWRPEPTPGPARPASAQAPRDGWRDTPAGDPTRYDRHPPEADERRWAPDSFGHRPTSPAPGGEPGWLPEPEETQPISNWAAEPVRRPDQARPYPGPGPHSGRPGPAADPGWADQRRQPPAPDQHSRRPGWSQPSPAGRANEQFPPHRRPEPDRYPHREAAAHGDQHRGRQPHQDGPERTVAHPAGPGRPASGIRPEFGPAPDQRTSPPAPPEHPRPDRRPAYPAPDVPVSGVPAHPAAGDVRPPMDTWHGRPAPARPDRPEPPVSAPPATGLRLEFRPAPVPPGRPIDPHGRGMATPPPVSTPPVAAPPVSAPPVAAPPVSAPPVSAPPAYTLPAPAPAPEPEDADAWFRPAVRPEPATTFEPSNPDSAPPSVVTGPEPASAAALTTATEIPAGVVDRDMTEPTTAPAVPSQAEPDTLTEPDAPNPGVASEPAITLEPDREPVLPVDTDSGSETGGDATKDATRLAEPAAEPPADQPDTDLTTVEQPASPAEPGEPDEPPVTDPDGPADAVDTMAAQPTAVATDPSATGSGAAEAVDGPAQAVDGPAQAVDGPAQAVDGPAEAIGGPAQAVDGPARAPEPGGPEPADAPTSTEAMAPASQPTPGDAPEAGARTPTDAPEPGGPEPADVPEAAAPAPSDAPEPAAPTDTPEAAAPTPTDTPESAATEAASPGSAPAADPEQILAGYRWRLDPETLREVVDRPDELRSVRDRLTDKLGSTTDNRARARLLSLRAVVSRILGDLDPAVTDARLALTLAEATRELRRIAIAQARLAHVLQWRGEFTEADRLFAEANSPELPDRLRATMHEHAGRSCYDQRRYMEACNHFERALDLRKVEDSELIARTELALDAVFEKVATNGWGPYPRSAEEVRQPQPPPLPSFEEQLQRWGYADSDGELVIAADFVEVQPFREDLAWVRQPQAANWMLIDSSGETVIPPTAGYPAVGSFSDGLAWVYAERAGAWMAIDRANTVVIPPGFDDVRPFRRGVAAVRRGGWGAVDKGGQLVVPTRYSGFTTALTDGRYIDGFTDEGLAVIDAGGRRGVVDRTGRVIVPPGYPTLVIHPVAFLFGDAAGRWGALDRHGEPLIDPVHRSRAGVLAEIDRLLADTTPLL